MANYEYKFIPLNPNDTFLTELTTLGHEGWYLVTIRESTNQAILVKQIDEEAEDTEDDLDVEDEDEEEDDSTYIDEDDDDGNEIIGYQVGPSKPVYDNEY